MSHLHTTQLFQLEMKLKFFKNTFLQANIRSQSAKEICGDAVYIDKVGKSITRPVSEVEKSFLGQHGVEFQVKMIGNIKIGQNTPGTAGGPGGRDRTLAVKSLKNRKKSTFFRKIFRKKIKIT